MFHIHRHLNPEALPGGFRVLRVSFRLQVKGADGQIHTVDHPSAGFIHYPGVFQKMVDDPLKKRYFITASGYGRMLGMANGNGQKRFALLVEAGNYHGTPLDFLAAAFTGILPVPAKAVPRLDEWWEAVKSGRGAVHPYIALLHERAWLSPQASPRHRELWDAWNRTPSLACKWHYAGIPATDAMTDHHAFSICFYPLLFKPLPGTNVRMWHGMEYCPVPGTFAARAGRSKGWKKGVIGIFKVEEVLK